MFLVFAYWRAGGHAEEEWLLGRESRGGLWRRWGGTCSCSQTEAAAIAPSLGPLPDKVAMAGGGVKWTRGDVEPLDGIATTWHAHSGEIMHGGSCFFDFLFSFSLLGGIISSPLCLD
jgi:hypothetical protein